MVEPNALYYGDNLDVLRRHVPDQSVDLVYLDPPFKSDADYNVLFAEHGEKAAAQVQAFTDTWTWDATARLAYEEVVEAGGKVAEAMRAFRTMLGASDMLAYLAMMAPRLIELRNALRPQGFLWLHCDPTASHYLKLLLDATFGPQNFRNEVIWERTTAKSLHTRRLPSNHDVLLVYAKDASEATWHLDEAWTPNDPDYIAAKYPYSDADGRRYGLWDLTNPNPNRPNLTYEFLGVTKVWRWTRERMQAAHAAGLVVQSKPGGVPRFKRYLDEQRGKALTDVWTDIAPINSQAHERLRYPTQKPLALMERILRLGTEPGDVVLDPFCGCGTTIDAAQALDRRWIGIDITHLSIGLIKHRLVDRYGPEIAKTYRVIGEPTTADDAAVLAREDPFQFQAWALGLVGARVAGSDKKGGDKGIDGRLYFHDSASGPTRQIVLSVKAGHLVPAYVRDLRGVLQREDAEIGVLLSFEEPTTGMRSEAAEAGFYESPWGKHPRIQLLTIAELLDGKGIDYPHVTGSNVTLRRSQRARGAEPERLELFSAAPEESDPLQ
ncbi:MAG: DNA methyltransferase [Chloroflexota bacterium]